MTDTKDALPVFTAEDFMPEYILSGEESRIRMTASNHATKVNARLAEWQKGLTIVRLNRPGINTFDTWTNLDRGDCDTHSALIFNIQEIAPKECEHVPDIRWDAIAEHGLKCAKCGAKLKAKWEEE